MSQWVQDLQNVLNLLIGPYGVVVVLSIVVFFLYRLYRDAIEEGKKSQANVATLTEAVTTLTGAVKTSSDDMEAFFNRWSEAQLSFREFVGEIRQFMGKQK